MEGSLLLQISKFGSFTHPCTECYVVWLLEGFSFLMLLEDVVLCICGPRLDAFVNICSLGVPPTFASPLARY